MHMRSLPKKITAWLAAWAVLWGALLPVLSHAVVAHQAAGNGWVEVCTATGMAWVKSADDVVETGAGSQPAPASSMVMAGCDWCATHNTLTGLPAAAQPPAVPLVFGPEAPAAFLHAPRPLFVWAAAQSRAPPVTA